MGKRTNRDDTKLKDFHYSIIAFLSINTLCTVKEISNYFKVDKSYLYPILNNLERLGYIVTTNERPKCIKLIENEFNE